MRLARGLLNAVLALAVASGLANPAHAHGIAGAVYTMDNSPHGNRVLVFARAADGTLTADGSFETGGLGTGTGLGSQGALVPSSNERWLFAVNAGSDEISAFEVEPSGLSLVDRVPSGGRRPISLTVHDDLLYVLNAGGAAGDSDNITGFRLDDEGHLAPIAGSLRPLSAASTGPAQIQFEWGGRVLVVTEKATNLIDTYTIDEEGLATGPVSFPSPGQTPFGFDSGKRNQIFVSEAFGGAPDASAVSSFLVSRDGMLRVISPSVPTRQTAACWVVVTPDGRFAYASNTGSGTISGYRIGFDGSPALLQADGRTADLGPGTEPIDMALSVNGRYLYVLNSGTGTIGAFRVNSDGTLAPLAAVGGLPTGTNGLAAR